MHLRTGLALRLAASCIARRPDHCHMQRPSGSPFTPACMCRAPQGASEARLQVWAARIWQVWGAPVLRWLRGVAMDALGMAVPSR